VVLTTPTPRKLQIANQFDIEKTPSQQAITNKVIQSREAEINEIFQPGT
jgi:hypothetical protein